MNELLLDSIHSYIDTIVFDEQNETTNYRCTIRAKVLCSRIFNLYMNDDYGVDFDLTQELATTYFNIILAGDRANVKKGLENAGVLITDGKYVVGKNGKKGKCKRYCFNPDLIYNHNIEFTSFIGIAKVNDHCKYQKINDNLKLLTVDRDVFAYIPVLVAIQLEDNNILNGDKITEEYVTVKIDNVKKNKHRNECLKIAKERGLSFFKFKKRYYIADINAFKIRKEIELKILYNYQIQRIINGNFYACRNTTNNRLDHNGTSLKFELYNYIFLDGEKTKEIDIVNSQFTVFANIPDFKLDHNFRSLSQKGFLYEFIMSQIEPQYKIIKSETEKIALRKKAKNYMFQALFGYVANHSDMLIDLFPITMASIAEFKNEFGYKQFSIILQKYESNLMIDGVFNMITNENTSVIPVHDSMRVKESEYDKVKCMIENFFIEKNFICTLAEKEK